VIFRQFVDDDLGCASYLVGDPEAGEAVVIDPAFAIEQYLDAARAEGVRIVRVLETHTHADHVSGHGRFALEHGVPVSINPIAQPEYPFDPLEDGDVVRVGSVEIRAMHTPGHRPEHTAFVIDGKAVTTGDSLFVGEAARPDLAIEAREGAADLWRSMRRLAAELPDEAVVYPGHVAGSLCGTNMSEEHSTSMGRERRTNPVLTADRETFVEEASSIGTPRPPTTERVVALNRGPWLAGLPALEPLETVPDGATLLDVRPIEAFAAGHVPGAVSVALDGGSFATRAAFVIDSAEPVVVHAQAAAEAQEAARLLRAVGLFDQRGHVLEPDGATARTATVTVPELARLLEEDGDVQVLDVREESEREVSALPGAVEVPYRELRIAPPEGLDPDRPVYAICGTGARSMLAASLLERSGLDVRPMVGGGMGDLLRARRELVQSA